VLVAMLTPIRAGDSGGDEEEEAKPPKKKGRAKGKKPKAKKASDDSEGEGGSEAAAADSAPSDAAAKAIAALPVEPLSMDAAALKDDDRQFDMLPKALSGDENVDQLTAALTKATTLFDKMRRDVESEKVWTKNVYDIIQNYQYKYVKTVKDVREREQKVAKLEALIKSIKQSTLRASVQRELTKASKAISELVTRSGGSTDEAGRYYQTLNEKVNRLKSQLKALPPTSELYSETTNKMKAIMRNRVPPQTADALKQLTADEDAAPAKPAKAPKADAPKKAPKAAKADKAGKAPKKGGKKGKKGGKKGKGKKKF